MHTHIYSYAQNQIPSSFSSMQPLFTTGSPMEPPTFHPEPPPWRQEAGVDYTALMILDLKADVCKTDIRKIFQAVACEFGGHGCTFHKTLRETIIPYKGLVLAYLCVCLYAYLSTTPYIYMRWDAYLFVGPLAHLDPNMYV